MAVRVYSKTDESYIEKNFRVREFACKGKGCCDTVMIDPKLAEYLQKIRDHFGKAVTISSGYRCPTRNGATKNASKTSKHTQGMAADIVVKGVAPAEVAKYAESIGILGIGLYEKADCGSDFVHVDTRTNKSFWYGHRQAYRDTFGGSAYVPTVLEWQLAAIADGFKFPDYGADGAWGAECISVANKAIVKKRLIYKHKNLTKLVQKAVGVTADGKCGKNTRNAIIEYQKAHHLVEDGEVGLNTWKRILNIG